MRPTGKCKLAHCYNAHAFLTVGCIPGANNVRYGNIRNRVCDDGTNWLQPSLLSFFNCKLEESNELMTPSQERLWLIRNRLSDIPLGLRHIAGKVYRFLKRAVKK